MNLIGAALRSSPQPFYHKRVIDRVPAAAQSLHSPSHYDQLALFSLFLAIGGGKGAALSQRCLISTTKGGLKPESRREMIDIFLNPTATAMFSIIVPLCFGEIRLKSRLFMIRRQVKSGSLTHMFHFDCYVFFFFLQFSKWLKRQRPKACLLLFTAQLSQRLYLKHTIKKKIRGSGPLRGSREILAFPQRCRVERETLLRVEQTFSLGKK